MKSHQISQRNNGEEIKENSIMEEIYTAVRNSYQANRKNSKDY